MRVTAIIVARGGSRRVPGKALRPFGSSTLIGHKVDQLRQCERVDHVIVGSDCPGILNEAIAHGADTRRRDDYHCDESLCTANDMIRNMVEMVEADVVLWAHPTNPLCTPSIYDDAVRAFEQALPAGYDSLASVTAVRRHAWNAGFKPENFNPWGEKHPFASELAPLYFQDGAIFIQPRDQMLRNAYFYGARPRLFPVEFPYGFDVDTEADLSAASALHGAGVTA